MTFSVLPQPLKWQMELARVWSDNGFILAKQWYKTIQALLTNDDLHLSVSIALSQSNCWVTTKTKFTLFASNHSCCHCRYSGRSRQREWFIGRSRQPQSLSLCDIPGVWRHLAINSRTDSGEHKVCIHLFTRPVRPRLNGIIILPPSTFSKCPTDLQSPSKSYTFEEPLLFSKLKQWRTIFLLCSL